MAITRAELDTITARLNAKLASYSAAIKPSVHFGIDRLNDLRNKPPIGAMELQDVFMRFIAQHIDAALRLNNGETFNIRCLRTHINMPCEVRKYSTDPKHQMYVITIMRHKTFFSKDPHEFQVK